jgi:hypothetical protein
MAETINRDPFYQGRKGYEGMLNDVNDVLVPLERYADSCIEGRSATGDLE